MEQVILLQGGIGDFLQCLPFIRVNQYSFKYCCVTHLTGAQHFFDSIGLRLESLSIFRTEEEKIRALNALPKDARYLDCPRTQYFAENPFKLGEPLFNNGKLVLGIHINGSAYAIKTQKQSGVVLKSLPARLIKELISSRTNLLIFGLKHEVEPIGLKESDHLRLVAYENPAKSLAYVQQCNAVIGSDSGIKTMSAMLKIPTLVWLGDYQDPPRDQMFINPYVNDGVMQVFRYRDVNAQFNAGVRQSKEFLESVRLALGHS